MRALKLNVTLKFFEAQATVVVQDNTSYQKVMMFKLSSARAFWTSGLF